MDEPKSPARILIVDDDPLDRELYKRNLLKARGRSFLVAEEATGGGAFARIAEFAPDCILLDFNLPDMNGVEVLERLKNGPARLPAAVVVLTAVRDEMIAVAAMKSGATDYLPKGEVDAGTIAHAIDNAIEKFRLARAVDEEQARNRSLIEAMPQVVWIAGPDGRLEFANSRWFETLGIDLGRFNDEGWALVAHPDDRDRSRELWRRGLASGSTFQMEHRLRRPPADTYRWFLTRAAPICDAGGNVTKWFGTSTDVEEQKRGEMAMYNKQKLESLGLLAGGIAHDFNNLLVGILGGASLLEEALPESHPQQPVLAGIVNAAERAAHLTRQMLAYAGKGRFLIQQLDLNNLVQSTCDLIRASIPKNVTVTLEMVQDLPRVDADSTQLQQVIMNLVLNAAEAVEESRRGTVVVRTGVRTAEGPSPEMEMVAGALHQGRYVVLEVQDNGSGMDEATRRKIFEPFFTTKFTGRGLGLSAVEGILRGHGAAMELKTGPGEGSIFRVYLPAGKAATAGLAEEPQSSLKQKGAGTVLVVDDEEIVRRTARLSLENGGFDVQLASSGEEAIRFLLSHRGAPISLVLLDLSMPSMSGREVMQQIRRFGIELPVVICSGYSEAEIYKQFAGLDIAGFVAKPFTARQLAERVSKILYPERDPVQ